jgi:hypothetical protein
MADAQALLTELTGWMRIPGNPADAEHALGAVQDIYHKHKDKTKEYLETYWKEFRRRYPNSTRIFWLTDWAVQGKIPDQRRAEVKPGVIVPPTEYTAEAKRAAAREEYKRQVAKLEAEENANNLAK